MKHWNVDITFSSDEGAFTGNLEGIFCFLIVIVVSEEEYIKETIFFVKIYEIRYQDRRY